MIEVLKWVGLIVFGYLSGSVMYCNLIARKFGKKDLRKVSKDGNPGAANVFWYCGWKLGVLALALDVLKGLVPVVLARVVMGKGFDMVGGSVFQYGKLATESFFFSFVMLSPVLGHAFPIFEKLKGGKCISTSLGVMSGLIGISPAFYFLGSLDIFFSFIAKIKIGNVRALVFYSLFVVIMTIVTAGTGQYAILLGCVMISVLVISKHLPLMADKKEKK